MIKEAWSLVKNHTFSFQWIIWMISVLHLLWGILLLFGPVSSTFGGILWSIFIDSGPRELWGVIFISSACLSLWGSMYKKSFIALLMMQPQQFMLTAPAIDILFHWSIEFVNEDKLTMLFHLVLAWSLLVFHTLAIFDQYVYTPWKRFRHGK